MVLTVAGLASLAVPMVLGVMDAPLLTGQALILTHVDKSITTVAL
jgi:hypothetical protein